MSETRWTEQYGREVIGRWRRSGQSMSAFGHERGINPQRLRYWRERVEGKARVGARASGVLKQKTRSGTLVPGVLVGVGVRAPVSVHLSRGVVVEIQSAEAIEPAWLVELALALEQAR